MPIFRWKKKSTMESSSRQQNRKALSWQEVQQRLDGASPEIKTTFAQLSSELLQRESIHFIDDVIKMRADMRNLSETIGRKQQDLRAQAEMLAGQRDGPSLLYTEGDKAAAAIEEQRIAAAQSRSRVEEFLREVGRDHCQKPVAMSVTAAAAKRREQPLPEYARRARPAGMPGRGESNWRLVLERSSAEEDSSSQVRVYANPEEAAAEAAELLVGLQLLDSRLTEERMRQRETLRQRREARKVAAAMLEATCAEHESGQRAKKLQEDALRERLEEAKRRHLEAAAKPHHQEVSVELLPPVSNQDSEVQQLDPMVIDASCQPTDLLLDLD